jgi:hypothetical protein
MFSVQHGLKQGDALSAMFLNWTTVRRNKLVADGT